MVFGEEKFDKFNFLPVCKFILPVNKANAVKSGSLGTKDALLAVDKIMIDCKSNNKFKNNLIMMDILVNFDWKRPISFSFGGVDDDENIVYLNDYLQFDGFRYL